MEITKYLDLHGILWQPLKITIKSDGKKTPVPFKTHSPKNNDFEFAEIVAEFDDRKKTNEKYDYIAVYANKIQQFDVDVVEYNTSKYQNGPYFESITKRTPHFFMIIPGGNKYQLAVEGGDLLMSGWSFARKKELVHNYEAAVPHLSIEDFPRRRTDELRKIVADLSTVKYEYNTWIRYCMAILNAATEYCEKDPHALVEEFSSRNSEDTEKDSSIIRGLQYKNDGVKLPTLIEAHKLKFPEQYSEKRTVRQTKKKDSEEKDPEKVINYEEWKELWERNVFVLLGRKPCIINDYLLKTDKKNGYLVEEHFGSMLPFREINEYTELSLASSFKNGKTTNCVSLWKNDSNKRTYISKNFLPPYSPDFGNPKIYNTWKDYYLEDHSVSRPVNKSRVIQVYKDYRLHIASNDESVADYLVQLDASIAQKPGIKPGVCIVYCGKTQGTGKGTDLRLLRGLFGDYVKQVSDIKTILGTFTNTLSNTIVIQIDEAVPIEMISTGDRLKSLITETTVKIEQKGKDAYEEYSYHRLSIASNSDYPVKVEGYGERRFIFLSPTKLMPSEGEHPKDIHALTKDIDCLKILFDYLKNEVDLKYETMYDWQENRPITQKYKEARENFVPTYQAYMNQMVSDFVEIETDKKQANSDYAIKDTIKDIKFDLLYEEYRAHCEDSEKKKLDRTKFSLEICKMGGVKHSDVKRKVDPNTGRKHTYYDIDTSAFMEYIKEQKLTTRSL